ncbi:3-isopropylmalate dehydratase small subunit [Wenzhouxiangella sp. AB-CW3]|uniref:3-isopropylmalate dehydratase small subunit n=1 Tax=Wenzhouxiangella sp. AB-CW3 TaxID=2771012 RepID=UPI00168B2F20|nr:3-isopropylmalate dehydratase small subunit [Wenzhouxiangella sp. AB-CW3]QOC22066.1 3-isopropylmalate dehydratase small subunit [Wenzhouxiangella sp. AB-CW3]
MTPLKHLQSTTVVLTERNIDTDQIVPARFLTTTNRLGLGQAAFADWRYDKDGSMRSDCPLNAPDVAHSEILVAGENFGCGSSREHAVWALSQFGFRVVISSRIADIFRANALRNGLLAIEVDADTHAWLLAHPGAEVTVDVDRTRLHLPDGHEIEFGLDPFARTCLMEGVDALGYLLAQERAIAWFEEKSREAA